MNPSSNAEDSLLIAIGGNAIHPASIDGTVAQQQALARRTGALLLPIMRRQRPLIITHGNGPVVGKILMRQALARERVPAMSMDICVAHSQGGIAYLLMQAFENALRSVGDARHVVCLLTQVEVDPRDPAFSHPSKPVGFFYAEAEARDINRQFGWLMKEDAGRGWRHIVPSPAPRHIVDISLIDTLLSNGSVVIAGGGGGIPVVRREDGTRYGIEAVIDKDLTSALIGNVLAIPTLLLLTGSDGVFLAFGKPEQKLLREIGRAELAALLASGEFATGSMAPKVAAALQFLDGGGKHAIIANLEHAEAALAGASGTHIRSEQ